MTDTNAVSLEELCGLHTLRGIATDLNGQRGDDPSTRVVLLFDDDVLVFRESTNDSYRSDLDSVERYQSPSRWLAENDDVHIAPIHPPLVVEVRLRTTPEHGGDGAHAIYAINERTGLVVLDIGTDNIDDYYPSFVFQWNPEGWSPKWLEAE